MTHSREFSPELCELIGWFRLPWHMLPGEPFTLRPGHRVVDPQKFYGALAHDIRAGPDGPRARSPALQRDLGDLRRHIESITRDCDHDYGRSTR
jgi:hypothetical protein